MVNANPQRQLSEQQVSERSLSERPVNPTSPPRHGSAALLLGAWLWTGLATAQNPPTQPPTPPQGQDKPAPVDMKEEGDYITFAFNEANGMELAEFIKYAERMTHRVFVLGNEQELATAGQGTKVTFVGTLHFRKERLGEDFFAFFQTMLYIKGFALVPRGEGKQEMLEIVAMSGQRGREITNGAHYVPLEDIESYRSQTGVPILTTMPLRHINATVATNSLRPFFSSAAGPQAGSSVALGNVGNNSAMLLQGFGPQVYAAVQLLKLVDVPTEAANLQIRVQRLEYAAAEEIEPLLNDILNDRSRIRQQQVGQPGQGGVPTGDPSGTTVQLKIAVHQSLHAIILSGTTEQIQEAQELIAKLDIPAEPVDGKANVIRLKNVLADDLRKVLAQFVQQDAQAEQQAQAGAATPGGGGAARRPRPTVIQSHTESNSLLVSASKSKFEQIHALIMELDQRQPQVLIEAALVELTTGDLTRLGVELGVLDLPQNGGTFNKRGFGFTSFGQSTFQDTDGNGLPDTRLPDFTNPLQGITGGIISGSNFGIPLLVNALSSDNRANILSLPSVLVNNNETAVVKTNESRPTLQSNTGTATTTQSAGAPRDAGISLEISPSISTDKYLRLNINLQVSRFVGAFDPNSPTGGGTILSRNVKTQVTMPSDDTMVIGGVIEDQASTVRSGIPLLKDIPLLGWLFSSNDIENSKTNLYFFLTPTILGETDFQDLYELSLKRKMEAEHYIGTERLQIVDHKWTGAKRPSEPRIVEDGTHEDLDAHGYNENPYYPETKRDQGPRKVPSPTGPDRPEQKPAGGKQ